MPQCQALDDDAVRCAAEVEETSEYHGNEDHIVVYPKLAGWVEVYLCSDHSGFPLEAT